MPRRAPGPGSGAECPLEIDAMILDLELPGGSGILLLEKLHQMQIPKPFIAVVTNVVSQPIYQTIRMLGADYICAKGEKGFSLNVPISIIEISAPYQTKKQAPLQLRRMRSAGRHAKIFISGELKRNCCVWGSLQS